MRAAALVAVVAFGVGACSSSDSAGVGEATTTEAPPSGKTSGGELRVLSYNVAGLPAEVSDEDPAKHIPMISPLLEEYDLVLTQEDFDWWKPDSLAAGLDFVHYHERLRAEATHEYRSEVHPGHEAAGLAADRVDELQIGDGLGILSRSPIQGAGRIPWVGCFGGIDTSDGGAADCLAMKGFFFTQMTLADGAIVHVYDLHGEAGGSERDQALQADDFEQLGAYIEEHSKGFAVILGGDTNLHTDEPGPDAHEDSGNGKDLQIWQAFLDATGLTDACAATRCDGPGRIDKFAFRSGKGVELEATSHQFHGDTFVDEEGEALSDHEPLEVRFRWTPI
ncbi:MAG: endonuclease [Acidimicrobiales bacterium]|nr:endonuclease [Acidimicrobiales bacterium]